MTIFEIIKAWLIEHGYDGLAGDHCGCEATKDSFPCEDCTECVPAYKFPCLNNPKQSCFMSDKKGPDKEFCEGCEGN